MKVRCYGLCRDISHVNTNNTHNRPHFTRYHPQLDQRSVKLLCSHNATSFPLWARIATLVPGKTIALPVAAWPQLLTTIASTSHALAPVVANNAQRKREKANAKREENGQPPAKRPLAVRSTALCSLPQTVRLIVRPQDKHNPSSPLELSLGLVVDHQALRTNTRKAYQPIHGKVVAFDLGGATLLSTSDGDLLGRNWLARIERWDSLLVKIAQGQQKRGLPVATPRYRTLVQQIDGFLKTNIFRIVNAWVDRVRPEKIVREDSTFHLSPNLSKRLNRLLSRFGKRYLEQALKRLESTHGIVVERREGAYTSQQCHGCGYTDAKNRVSQSVFRCRFCGNTCHADVNAARVLHSRRSAVVSVLTVRCDGLCRHKSHVNTEQPTSTTASRKRLLHAQVAAFQAAHPFVPRAVSFGNQSRARGRTDDPRWENPYFREACQAFLHSGKPTPPSVFAREQVRFT